ncbi:UDP-glycosyltransferase [Flavobacterium sp. MAH-1]|uniref:UDP-glycosyltransferase n=1 Tax=Flavobacterium agri TaxID=2743471 RepID=A0A7Y9C703_9FLAO|nr:UDP-glycosyltransferase [Flavobacterium agri]NUY80899.1 UDP-glycosyltransferase [Flavobacterium agri]NYA70923.1 UDP-glycosyltransferase [Flavobacterium agri]
MSNRSIFILLPDGVGLRNFAYSKFPEIAKAEGFDLTFWNNTPFDLTSLGLTEIKVENARPRPLTDILRRARSIIDLNRNIARSNDSVYEAYRQKLSSDGLKNKLKSFAVKQLSKRHDSEKGLETLRRKIKDSERKSAYYASCVETLKREKPAAVFCTNQRPLTAIAPILAAQDLGIPTIAFVFSWDNVPKATMVIEADFYFVWSDHMKQELLFYYPYIPAENIIVTGTPQFESHFDKSLLQTREAFFAEHRLDLSKKYICYSGDDITTSPNDPQYLADVAKAVRQLNEKGHNLGILFRRCPVDFSDRFDDVLQSNKDLIVPVAPEWKKLGSVWNTVLPMREDVALQANTIAHTEMVVNLGSSMVFDYVSHEKPCAFVNYDPTNNKRAGWSVKKIYNYVHFRSMPDKKAVVWLNSPEEIASKLESALTDKTQNVAHAHDWFGKINQHPPTEASRRIFNSLKTVIGCTSVS